MAGYTVVDVEEPDGYPGTYSAEGSFITFDIYGGARFYFTDNIGVFAEVGYGALGYVNGGIVLKF